MTDYIPPAPVTHVEGATIVIAPKDDSVSNTADKAFESARRSFQDAPSKHECSMTKLIGTNIMGTRKTILAWACTTSSCEKTESFDLGDRDAMRLKYVEIMGGTV